MKIIDLSAFDIHIENGSSLVRLPDFTFLTACSRTAPARSAALATYSTSSCSIAPVAFVVLAEHIADHKNLGLRPSIGKDLIWTDPGLDPHPAGRRRGLHGGRVLRRLPQHHLR